MAEGARRRRGLGDRVIGSRRMFIACLLVLGVSLGAVGTIVVLRWQATRDAAAMVPRWWLTLLLSVVGLLIGLSTLGMLWTAERLRRLATTDELTRLANRRYFLERWYHECDRAARYRRPLSCLMIDVRGLKGINDTLGHRMGDLLLQAAAGALTASLRRSDLIARLGGDEFAVALPETDRAAAVVVAEKLRALAIPGPWGQQPGLGPVALSVGHSQWQSSWTPEEVLQQADHDLYATRAGARENISPIREGFAV